METCDDGNTTAGDGCSPICTTENNSDGGVPTADAGVPMNSDAGVVPPGPTPSGDSGGCSTAPGQNAPVTMLLLIGLAMLRRRRR